MSKLRAFVSFDVDNDESIKHFLIGQSKLPDSPFEFKDNSVKEHLTGDWKEKVSRRMDNVDVVIILCGSNTNKATGVAAELQITLDKKKPYFLLAAYSDKTCVPPAGTPAGVKIYKWTWDNLKALLSGRR
jgi:hypothetical protein